MSKIWLIKNDVDGFFTFIFRSREDEELCEEYITRGKKITEWKNFELIREIIEGYNNKKIADFSRWSSVIQNVVDEKTKAVLEDRFSDFIQFLPVTMEGTPYYFMHIFNAVDALDYDNSTIKRFNEGGIMRIKKYVFTDKIKDYPITRIYEGNFINPCDTFVNDEFKEFVEENGLTGLIFKEVFEFSE